MRSKINEKIADSIKQAAVKVAMHYANVTCPFLTYQPQISKEVKKLRKF